MDISARIFKFLSTIDEKSYSGSELSAEEPDSESELPFECCFCSVFFFEELKFRNHDCQHEKLLLESVTNKPEVVHKCTFGECEKVFKKSSDLRKHEVRGFIKNLPATIVTIFIHTADPPQHQEFQVHPVQ